MARVSNSREDAVSLRLRRVRKMPLQHRGGRGVGFLQVHAPVLQLVERNPRVGDRAAHERSRRDHAEIAVEILHLRFAMARGAELVQHGRKSPWRAAPGRYPEGTMCWTGCSIDRVACPPGKPTAL